MVVVAIAALLLSIAGFTITRSRRRVTVERSTADLRSRIERARSLAAVAGSRLGTPRLAFGAGCTADPDPQLWIRFNGPQVEVPGALDYDVATDLLTVSCEVFDLAVETDGNGAFNLPAAPAVFSFTASGRLVIQSGFVGPNAFIQLQSVADTLTFGFRVLPSGVVCRASLPAGAVCDEDTGA